MFKWLRRLIRPQAGRRSRSQDKPKTAMELVNLPILIGSKHHCPRCTDPLVKHPLKELNFCPMCGLRLQYPEDNRYGLRIMAESEYQDHRQLWRLAEQIAGAVDGRP